MKKLFGNQYLVSVLKKGNTILFGLISVALYSRAMGPVIKGEYDTYLNTVSILIVLLNFGISTIYPNYKRKKENWVESTFIIFSIFQFMLYSLFSLVASLCFGMLYGIFCFCITTGVLAIQLNNTSLVENYIHNALANILSVVVNALLALGVFLNHITDVKIMLVCYCIKELSLSVVALYFLRLNIHIRDMRIEEFKGILKLGFVPMLTNLLIMVNYKIDVIFLNLYHIEYFQIGLYTAGLGIAEYAWIIPDIFKDVLINKTARTDDLESVKFCLRVSSTFLIIAYVILIFFGKLAISILYGNAYLQAYDVTVVVFLGVYGMVYCKLLGTLYLAQGKWNFYFFSLLVAVIVNVITNTISIPLLGIKGAAITTIVSYSCAGGAFLIDFKKKYRCSFSELLIVNRKDSQMLKCFLRK